MFNKKKIKEKRLAIKMIICLFYLIVITILFACSYYLFQEKNKIVPWSEVESVEDYTYIDIYKMSEKFAFYEKDNIGLHFVIEKEDTGLWHTYIIAINEANYDEYKSIIDYTYERTTEVPEVIRVYGYPVITSNEIKGLAIKNIPNFVPAENQVVIDEANYESYLTNSYLDTTKEQNDKFSILLCICLFLLFIVMGLLITTILDQNMLVDTIDKKIEQEIKRTKRVFKRNK